MALRKALHDCRLLVRKTRNGLEEVGIIPEAHFVARDIGYRRQDVLDQYESKDENIDILDKLPTNKVNFIRQYEIPPRPCLVRNATDPHFTVATRLWNSHGSVNREWFQSLCAVTTTNNNSAIVPVVPVMKTDADSDDTSKIEMKLDEWMGLLDTDPVQFEKKEELLSDYYLKDWHLQQYLLRSSNQGQDVKTEPLYTVPEPFGYDLMNEFWMKYTNGNTDYRFVYWGPKDSTTDWHGDILYTFSWSYNVCGVKDWKFEVPGTDRIIRLRQKAGELVFAPSFWRHSVTNVEETLSINHNWMTTSNVDLVWESLYTGRQTIEIQLAKDKVREMAATEEKGLFEASGGMNYSVLFFMILTRGLTLLLQVTNVLDWETSFSLVRLRDMIHNMIEDDRRLRERLAFCLSSDGGTTLNDPDADEAIRIGRTFVNLVDDSIALF